MSHCAVKTYDSDRRGVSDCESDSMIVCHFFDLDRIVPNDNALLHYNDRGIVILTFERPLLLSMFTCKIITIAKPKAMLACVARYIVCDPCIMFRIANCISTSFDITTCIEKLLTLATMLAI